MYGHNYNEGNLFVYPPILNTTPATAADVRCNFQRAFGSKAESLLQHYAPVDMPGIDNRGSVANVISDLLFHCPARNIAVELTKQGHAPWLYSFRHQPACLSLPVPGAAHGTEIAYVFDYYGVPAGTVCRDLNGNATNFTLPAQDVALAKRMSGMWADFARNGKPEANWPRYSLPSEPLLKLDISTLTAMDIETGYRRSQCDALSVAGIRAADTTVSLYTGLLVCQK